MIDLVEGVKKMPKIELHAHLSGSVRYSTLIELVKQGSDESEKESDLSVLNSLQSHIEDLKEPRELSECFKVFGILHRLIKNGEILKNVTRHVLDDFRSDNCAYLELRTTPRCILDSAGKVLVSKREYIELILNTIDEFEADNSDMLVRVILSVDRARSVEDGLETIKLCNELKQTRDKIIGVDFSGNPNAGSLREKFLPCLNLVREYGLPSTIHIGEMWNDDADLEFVMSEFRPERIGHAVCLSESQIARLIERPIPIEICPTSNLTTRIVPAIEEHRFGDFYCAKPDYPMVVCTDDCGLFDTSLTRENLLIAQAFKLSLRDVFELNKRSTGLVFDKSSRVRDHLTAKFDRFEKEFL